MRQKSMNLIARIERWLFNKWWMRFRERPIKGHITTRFGIIKDKDL